MRIGNSLHYDSLDISVFYVFVEYGACQWMRGARWDLCTRGKAEHTPCAATRPFPWSWLNAAVAGGSA